MHLQDLPAAPRPLLVPAPRAEAFTHVWACRSAAQNHTGGDPEGDRLF